MRQTEKQVKGRQGEAEERRKLELVRKDLQKETKGDTLRRTLSRLTAPFDMFPLKAFSRTENKKVERTFQRDECEMEARQRESGHAARVAPRKISHLSTEHARFSCDQARQREAGGHKDSRVLCASTAKMYVETIPLDNFRRS